MNVMRLSLRGRGLGERIAGPASRIAERAGKRRYLPLDYPPTAENRPRWGYGRPEHTLLAASLASHEDAYRASLETIRAYEEDLRAIPAESPDPTEPSWLNIWLPELDAAAIYAFLRAREPARYVEIGSGNSTLFAARARRDGDLDFRLISIDPEPRLDVDGLCDDAVRTPFEQADRTLLEELDTGDVIFLDGSHRTFMNSDATVFFLEVLPRLPSGVLVGVHDIFWPRDYPPEYEVRYYSEQYLLAAYLLGGSARVRPVLAANYIASRGELYGLVASLWAAPSLTGLRSEMNSSFWMALE
jgi:predicted O-methyltransferase YrrM